MLIPIAAILAIGLVVFSMCSGGFTPASSAGDSASLIPIAKEYTAQDRDEAAKVAGEFMAAVQKQDTAALDRLCPADAAVFDLKSYQSYFGALSSDAASTLQNALCSFTSKVDDVRIEGNQVEYSGAYRVRVSLLSYDVEAAEYSAGIVDAATRAGGLVDYTLEQKGKSRGDRDGLVDGYKRGREIGEDADENRSKTLAASLQAQGKPARESCVYLVVSKGQGGWAVAPVSSNDVVNLFGGWSAAATVSVSSDGKLSPSTLEKASQKRADRYSSVEPFAKGEGESGEGIEVADVQLYRSQSEDGVSVYRMTATVANTTGSAKDVILWPHVTGDDGEEHYSMSVSRSFGLEDDSYEIADYYCNTVLDTSGASSGSLWDTVEDMGWVLCVALQPGERRPVDLHFHGMDDSAWGNAPHPKLTVVPRVMEHTGPEGYFEGGAVCLSTDDAVSMTVDYVGYGGAQRESSHQGAEGFVVRGTIKNNTGHYIAATPELVSYAENGLPLTYDLDPSTYDGSGSTGWIAPGESGQFELFADDDRWLIDRVGVSLIGYAYRDGS